MKIRLDKLDSPEIIALLDEHHEEMRRHSPPGSIHALDLEGLKSPAIAFWSLWNKNELLGCVALKEISTDLAEIKSMRVTYKHQGKGIANYLMRHLLDIAIARGYKRLSLETGSMDGFDRARKLYEKFGFDYCGPFAGYVDDPNSLFMTKRL